MFCSRLLAYLFFRGEFGRGGGVNCDSPRMDNKSRGACAKSPKCVAHMERNRIGPHFLGKLPNLWASGRSPRPFRTSATLHCTSTFLARASITPYFFSSRSIQWRWAKACIHGGSADPLFTNWAFSLRACSARFVAAGHLSVSALQFLPNCSPAGTPLQTYA